MLVCSQQAVDVVTMLPINIVSTGLGDWTTWVWRVRVPRHLGYISSVIGPWIVITDDSGRIADPWTCAFAGMLANAIHDFAIPRVGISWCKWIVGVRMSKDARRVGK